MRRPEAPLEKRIQLQKEMRGHALRCHTIAVHVWRGSSDSKMKCTRLRKDGTKSEAAIKKELRNLKRTRKAVLFRCGHSDLFATMFSCSFSHILSLVQVRCGKGGSSKVERTQVWRCECARRHFFCNISPQHKCTIH